MTKTGPGLHIIHFFRYMAGSSASFNATGGVILLALIALLTINACLFARVVHYPGSFNWTGDKEVTTIMQSMGQSVLRLDELTSKDGAGQPDPDRQSKTLAELEKMEYQARLLPPEAADRHPWFEENLDYFISTLLLAKRQTQSDPPDYYTTGQLTAACNFCHNNFRAR